MTATANTYSAWVRTRYAPTPSGYLHLGNAVHFTLTAALAQEASADIVLRIDDIDRARYRREYLEDIFDMLEWLEIPWMIGPRNTPQMREWSQESRLPLYRAALDQLVQDGNAYACTCSRSQWQGYRGDDCPALCRTRAGTAHGIAAAWRLHLPGYSDPILWRRDGVPAYHLASVVDDDHLGVDFVVRGDDLRDSTIIQRALSRLLVGSTFHQAQVMHHGLITDAAGAKLSKSAGVLAAPMPRTNEMRTRIQQMAVELRSALTTTSTPTTDRPRSLES